MREFLDRVWRQLFGPDIEELLRPSGHIYYRSLPMPPGGWPARDTPQALKRSLDKAHDNLDAVRRENDRLRKALLEMRERQRVLLKVFLWVQGLTWAAVGGLVKFLLPYAIHGMAK